jgi:hypothetical protein
MARREVTYQARLAGCNSIEIRDGFRQWWFDDMELSHEVDPDKHRREVHGRESYGQVAYMVLPFVTTGTSEGEVERVPSVQNGIW